MKVLLAGLAAWRLAYALVYEEGPGRAFYRLREKSGIIHDDTGRGVGYTNDFTPLHCVVCTSFWTGIAVAFLPEKVRFALAVAAIALMVARYTEQMAVIAGETTRGE